MSKTTPYTQAGQALQRQHANSPAEVLKQRKAYLDARLDKLRQWVRGGIRPEALVRFCMLDMQQNQKLREADPTSVFLALLACAVTGLEPGALHGHAYLVPFGGKAQFMAGYKGLIKMAKRSGEVVGITSNVVHKADAFDIDLGTANSLMHKPALGDRGDVVGAYSIARMTHGHSEIEWVDIEDLDKIRKIAEARGKSPAWKEWPAEMQRKSAIRRLSKRLPLGHDYIVSIAIEQAQEEHGSATDVLDIETDGLASASESQASSAPVAPAIPDDDEAAEIARMEREGA